MRESASGEFPSCLEKYTLRQAHLEAEHLFLSQSWAQNPIIESDLSEPSAYLPAIWATAGKLGEIRTHFEVKLTKSARKVAHQPSRTWRNRSPSGFFHHHSV